MSSDADKAVLDVLFPFGPEADSTVPATGKSESAETEELKQSKQLEVEGVKAAERGALEEAIRLFSHSISISPAYASAYNNRAQAYRLLGDPESETFPATLISQLNTNIVRVIRSEMTKFDP